MKTYKELQPVVDNQKGEVRSSPLRNCFEEIVDQSMRELQKTDAGKQWFQAVKPVNPLDPSEQGSPVAGPDGEAFGARIERLCLRRLSQELPIYQILETKLRDVDLPLAERAVGS